MTKTPDVKLEDIMSIGFQKEIELAEFQNQNQIANRNGNSELDTFCTIELMDFLHLAKQAKVPFIPAIPIASIDVDTVTSFDDEDMAPDDIELSKQFWASIRKEADNILNLGTMFRWSCCAPADIKMALSRGEKPDLGKHRTEFTIDDLRAYDIVSDYPRKEITVYYRPWITPKKLNGYPLEFRVYVEEDKVIAVSQYYPQSALEETPELADIVNQCTDYVEAMIKAQHKPCLHPLSMSGGPDSNWWTADFLVSNWGDVLFLEGGPPHLPTCGAHPCCFDDRKPGGVRYAASKLVNSRGEII